MSTKHNIPHDMKLQVWLSFLYSTGNTKTIKSMQQSPS